MKELFGKVISNIYLSDDSTEIVFRGQDELHQDKSWSYDAVGDCCSHSWIESIENPEHLIDSVIIGIEEKPETEDKSTVDDDDECIRVYGYTLKTARGYTDIEFRNSSNGYYGGDLEYRPDWEVTFKDGKAYLGKGILKSVFFTKDK